MCDKRHAHCGGWVGEVGRRKGGEIIYHWSYMEIKIKYHTGRRPGRGGNSSAGDLFVVIY